jgi:hypothetical protein
MTKRASRKLTLHIQTFPNRPAGRWLQAVFKALLRGLFFLSRQEIRYGTKYPTRAQGQRYAGSADGRC